MEQMDILEVKKLEALAEKILTKTREGTRDGACVIALHGDLGAGKTTFTQTLARMLGVTDVVTSPTFVVMKIYNLLQKENQLFEKLVHIDTYRIEEIDEMRVLGFEKILSEKSTIMCIEWAENISELLPEYTIHIRFEIEGEGRRVTIE